MPKRSIRFVSPLFACLIALATGCGDDDTGGGTTVDSGTTATGGDSGSGGGTGDETLSISRVAWDSGSGCSNGTSSDVTITVTLAGGGTTSPTVSGTVTGCTGSLNALETTVNCPHVATYNGTVTVTAGAATDTAQFSFGPCESDSLSF